MGEHVRQTEKTSFKTCIKILAPHLTCMHTQLRLLQAVNRFPFHLPNKTIYQVLRLLSFSFISQLLNM